MKDDCVIIGAGTYGQVYAEYLKELYHIIGFIDDNVVLHGKKINNIEVIGDFDYLLSNLSKTTRVFVPIGSNDVREQLLNKLWHSGFATPNYIHPTVNIDQSVKVAKRAVYILQGTNVMPLSELREGVMISAGTTISHHTVIDAGVFISFGVNVGVSMFIENKAYLGIGCTIMTGVKSVGTNSLIGAGAVVIRDVPAGATVVGNPAKVIKIKS